MGKFKKRPPKSSIQHALTNKCRVNVGFKDDFHLLSHSTSFDAVPRDREKRREFQLELITNRNENTALAFRYIDEWTYFPFIYPGARTHAFHEIRTLLRSNARGEVEGDPKMMHRFDTPPGYLDCPILFAPPGCTLVAPHKQPSPGTTEKARAFIFSIQSGANGKLPIAQKTISTFVRGSLTRHNYYLIPRVLRPAFADISCCDFW